MAITTITNAMVSVNAIQGTLIADNAITAVHIATNAVSGTLIADNAVTATHIAQNVITVTQLADDAVEADKIADGVITTNHLNKAMISSQTEVAVATGDFILLGDTSDSNNLKKAPISSILAGTLTTAAQTNITSVGTLTSLATGDITIADGTVDITQSSTSTAVLRLTDAGVADYEFTFPDTSTIQINTSTSSNKTLKLLNAGSGLFSLDVEGNATVGGNVGIGTTSPSAQLHVQIAARTTDYSAANSSTWGDIVVTNPSGATNDATGIAFYNNASYHTNAATGIAIIKDSNSSDYGSHMAFVTRPHAAVAVERMRIQSDGAITMAGTLGVTGETTLASHLNMGDGDTIKLGNSSGDFEIYHIGGSVNVIRGTGAMVLQSDDYISLGTHSDGELMLKGTKNGALDLYYDNAVKLSTIADGITLKGGSTTGRQDIVFNNGSMSIANEATYTLSGVLNTGALISIGVNRSNVGVTYDHCLIFAETGTAATVVANPSGRIAMNSATTADKVNVFVNSGNIVIQNKVASTVTVTVAALVFQGN